MKLWSLYTRIKQNIYCKTELFIHHPLSQLPKQCGIEMTCTSHPSQKRGTQAFNNKKFRKTEAPQIQCSPCPNVTIPHQNNKLRKKCQQFDQLESSIHVFSHLFRSFLYMPLNPRNEYWIISPLIDCFIGSAAWHLSTTLHLDTLIHAISTWNSALQVRWCMQQQVKQRIWIRVSQKMSRCDSKMPLTTRVLFPVILDASKIVLLYSSLSHRQESCIP